MVKIREEKEETSGKVKVPIVFVCNQAHYYAFEEELR